MRRLPWWCWRFRVCVFLMLIAGPSLAYGQSAALTQNHRQGAALFKAGKFDEAIPFLKRALALSEREFGPMASRTGFEVKNLATLHEKAGNPDRAALLYRRALKILTASLGAEHTVTRETAAQSAQADSRAREEALTRTPITLTPPSPPKPPAGSDRARSGGGGGWAVQLGAFASLDNARKAAQGLGRNLMGVLDGAALEIREAQISSGRIYRVRTPSIGNRLAARALCTQIKASKTSCFIIKN
jgi:tetratricopeptide (TPR) repeat protein